MMSKWILESVSEPNSVLAIRTSCPECELEIMLPHTNEPPLPEKCPFCRTHMDNGDKKYNDSYARPSGFYIGAEKQLQYIVKASELRIEAQRAIDEYAAFTHYESAMVVTHWRKEKARSK